MRDDFQSAAWAANHQRLSAAIHKAIRAVSDGLARQNAYDFDAPWRRSDSARKPPAGQRLA